jgi:hypothetical protein
MKSLRLANRFAIGQICSLAFPAVSGIGSGAFGLLPKTSSPKVEVGALSREIV